MAITKIRIPKAPKAPKPSGSTSYVLGAQMDKPSKVKGKKPTKGLTLAQITGTAPRTPAESTTTGETIAAAPPVTPVAAPVTTTTTTPGVPPSASWWTNQYTASPEYINAAPSLAAKENAIGQTYGLVVNRDSSGKPLYKTASGGIGITQQFDDKGAMVYKDAAGKVYAPAELSLDITNLAPGQAGYLQGALGGASARSEVSQQNIGESAARSGVEKSGMRAQGALAETGNLQGTLGALSSRAAGEYGGVQSDWANLYNSIYKGLLPSAEALSQPTTSTTTTEGVAPEAAAPVSAAVPEPTYSGYNTPGVPTSGPLSAGPGGEFMTLIGDVAIERNTNDAAIRQALRGLLANTAYQLTAQQKAYINSLITGRYKGNKRY